MSSSETPAAASETTVTVTPTHADSVDSVPAGDGTLPAEPSSSTGATEPPVQGTEPSDSASAPAADSTSTKERADTLVAEGKKAIALKQWEEGVNRYAEALDLMRSLVGDQDPAMAPLLLSYGKALFELAFSQAGVMGKEEVEREIQREEAEAGPSNLVESADPELLAEADAADEGEAAGDEEPEAGGSGEAEAEDEPEDDYNAAWEVVDVARTIYLRVVDESKKEGKEKESIKEAELRLAECYETLGDISCETENFSQAASDYASSLSLITPYHPPSSRILATLHFQLGVALEFLPQRRADALSHVESALTAFRTRLAELEKPTEQMSNPDLAKLSVKDREAEKKEVGELIGDLEVKVEELKSAPEGEGLVEEGIRHLVGGNGSAENAFASGSGSGGVQAKKDDGPVNDLSGMVKKKKKPTTTAPAPQRTNGSAQAATTVDAVKSDAVEIAREVKTAVIHAAGKAAEVVEASVLASGAGGSHGATKREAEGETQEDDRSAKRVKGE